MTSPIVIEPQRVEILPVERLEALVLTRLGSRVRDFRIVLGPDGLVLRGRTTTYHAKQIAQHTVMEITDKPIAANDIEVC